MPSPAARPQAARLAATACADPTGFARRFIAGETVEEAIGPREASRRSGLLLTLDQLGESVATLAEAEAATRRYLAHHRAIVAAGIERNISLKLTQLGLDLDRDARRQPARASSTRAARTTSSCASTWRTRRTRRHARHLRDGVAPGASATSASCCSRRCTGARRTSRRVNGLGARVRLVKGAYKEPAEVAYQQKAEVDAAFVRMTRVAAATRAPIPAIATHDEAMIDATKAFAAGAGIAADRYEFQFRDEDVRVAVLRVVAVRREDERACRPARTSGSRRRSSLNVTCSRPVPSTLIRNRSKLRSFGSFDVRREDDPLPVGREERREARRLQVRDLLHVRCRPRSSRRSRASVGRHSPFFSSAR